MHGQRLKFLIIKSGSAQLFVIEIEPKGFDQMQAKAGIGAEANNIAGVGWNLRLVENNIEHSGCAGLALDNLHHKVIG